MDQLFSSKSRAVKKYGLNPEGMPEFDKIEWMVKEPALLKRPIAVKDGEAVTGFDAKKLEELVS